MKLVTARSIGIAVALSSAVEGSVAADVLSRPTRAAPGIIRTAVDASSFFEENRGQANSAVRFLSRGRRYAAFLTSREIVLALPAGPGAAISRDTVTVSFRRADPSAAIVGEELLPGRSNYFLGDDPARWRTGVPHVARVRYGGIYRGVDLICRLQDGELEHDFVLSPGADPQDILFEVRGARTIRSDSAGNLILRISGGDLVERAPVVYQEIGGQRRAVAATYVVHTRRARPGVFEVGFRLGPYDRREPLVIDPVLSYSTYLGGTGGDYGTAIAVDGSGNAYVTGQTFSADFPKQAPRQGTNEGSGDVFVTKLAQDGKTLVYSTFLGGTGIDTGNGISVDADGDAYVSGQTASTDFPTTPGAYRTSLPGPGGKAFVSKLDPTGASLEYSTLLGVLSPGGFSSSNTENGVNIAVDGSGNAYVTGATSSPDFPTTEGAFQRVLGSPPPNGGVYASDAFVTKVNAAGTDLVYSTYLGGIGDDAGNGIAVDGAGNAYVAGVAGTNGNNVVDFPTTPGAYETAAGRQGLGTFVAKVDPSGTSLLYATLVKGPTTESQNWPWGIAIDAAGAAYVTGQTIPHFTGADDFPTTAGAPQPGFGGGQSDAFVFKLNPTGSGLVYSTFLGGTGLEDIFGGGIAVDGAGNAYVAGSTASANFPSPNTLQVFKGGDFEGDAFLAKVNPTGTALLYSTLLGGTLNDHAIGVAVDSVGGAYVTGSTYSTDFPTTPGAFQTARRSQPNVFVAKVGELAAFGLSAIVPNVGGDDGTAAVVVDGAGFQPGVAVLLRRPGQADIVGDPVGVSSDGRSLDTLFDLHGAARGAWDVVVANPGGASATLTAAFTVEAGSGPQLWVDVVGRSVLRGGQVQRYNVVLGNRGDAAALGVPLWIAFPKFLTYKLDFPVQNPVLPTDQPPFDFSQVPIAFQTDTETVIPLYVGVVPAGSAGTFPIELTVPDDPQYAHAKFQVRVWFNDPFFGSPMKDNAKECIDKWISVVVSRILDLIIEKFVPVDCITGIGPAVISIFQTTQEAIVKGQKGEFTPADGATSMAKMLVPALKETIDCAREAQGYIIPEFKVLELALGAIPVLIEAAELAEACKDALKPKGEVDFPDEVITSGDPNDKFGPLGGGDAGHSLTGTEPLRYLIQFTNESTATAPAQDVVVTDPLDPTKVDLTTFSWGPIAFGSVTVTPPAGSADFTQDVDLRPDQDLIARISTHLNVATGNVRWHFASIDPATNMPTTDPTAGFLPPDKTPPEGEGSVSFSVKPKPGLPAGTQISNQASITFDVNPPIATAAWINTVDATKPSSHVLPLPAVESSASFPVSWTGTDSGSGIRDFTIFVSEDGGASSAFLTQTTATSAIFAGAPGHAYAFYSVARDLADNVEDAPPAADASTTVSVSAPVADLAIVSSLSGGVNPGGDLTITLTVSNGGPAAAQNVSVTDATPTGTAFVSASQNSGPTFLCALPPVGGAGTVSCTLSSLASGASSTFSMTFKIGATFSPGTFLTNQAVVGSSTADPSPDNNAATDVRFVGTPASQAGDALVVDPSVGAGSDGDGVLEPGETVKVQPAWRNLTGSALPMTGAASGLTGPAGATYTLGDASASYGSIPADAAQSCTATSNCYSLTVSHPAARPATHWDVQFTETPSTGDETKVWTLHVGDSFADVPRTQPFYKKIETLLHNGITSGCTATLYCPGATVSRGQMAIFVAKGLAGSGPAVPVSGTVDGAPYNCVAGGVSLFTDVAPTDTFCRHVHEIAAQNVTLGCSATQYCPNDTVTRLQMAAFIAKALVAPAGGAGVPLVYGPDPVTGFSYSCDAGSPSIHFTDVPASSSFCKHVHFLWARGIISGCTATTYCPGDSVTRDAMAKFLTNAFALRLYGP